MKALWRGEPLDRMSREQLIDIIHQLAALNEARSKDHAHALEMLR